MGEALMEFCLESTVKAIRDDIIDSRKTRGMTKDEARAEWNLSEALEEGDMSFDEWYGDSEMVDGFECHRTEVCGTWDNFWNRLWIPKVVPILKAITQK